MYHFLFLSGKHVNLSFYKNANKSQIKYRYPLPPLFPTIESPGNEATVTTETPMFIILQAKLTLKIEI